MKKAAVLLSIVLSALSVPAALAVQYSDFPTDLQLILDERIAELDTEGGICIAGQVTFSDGAPITSGADVMVNFYEGWDEPLWVYEGGWFIMGRAGSSYYAGADKGVVLRAFGYDSIDASVTILDGEMTYLEFEMAKTPPENLATVEGVVVNESNILFGPGAKVTISFPFASHGTSNMPYMLVSTDEHGQYSFEGLSICEHEVTAYALNYAYHRGLFTPPIGGTAVENRKLYPNRTIIIDYVYQADGSRDFTGGDLQTGTIEWLNGDGGVDFSEGQVEEYEPDDLRDIDMYQDQDILNFRISYSNGQNGFYDAGLTDFDEVAEAAEAGYGTSSQLCKVGHVYVVKTYEGKYAKFTVSRFQSAYRVVFSEICGPEPRPPLDFPGFGLSLSACFFDPSPLPSSNGVIYVSKFSNDIVGLGGGIVPYVWEITVSPDESWRVDVTVIYDEDDITSLGLSESELVLFRSFNNGTSWERLDSLRDTQNNTLLVEDVISFSWFIIGIESTQIIPKTIYVDASVVPSWPDPPADGLSWETAYNSLQDGLAAANEGDQIWVAEGTYEPYSFWIPPPPDTRAATFQLKSGVEIYGGFPTGGGEWPDRNPDLYETILDGSNNNNYHVVTGSGTDSSTILDGVTIFGGCADNPDPAQPMHYGGGMYNVGGSPTVNNCAFRNNYGRRGGGMANLDGSSPRLTNCTFRNNQGSLGGGLYNGDGCDPNIIDCNFTNNSGNIGGGMYSEYASLIVTGCTLSGNTAQTDVGGMYSQYCNLVVTNCTFTGNDGGGMSNGTCNLSVTDCTFSENAAYGMGNSWGNVIVTDCNFIDNDASGMRNFDSAPVVTSCRFIGNTAEFGAGMYNSAGSRPLLTNCVFSENQANMDGGGMYNEKEDAYPGFGRNKPVLIECTFSNNSANRHGGGMYSWDSDPNLTDCEFIGNWAKWGGGGMYNNRDCTVSMVNCTFTENSQTLEYRDGGGAILNYSNNTLILDGCTFTQNSATAGGALLNAGISTIRNCIFTENRGYGEGGAITDEGVINIDNCIFTENISGGEEHGCWGFGGAINLDESLFTITNSIFIDNTALCEKDIVLDDIYDDDIIGAGIGGTVHTSVSSGLIDSCLLAGNSAGIAGGLCLRSGFEPDQEILLNNCTVVGNSARYYAGALLLEGFVDVADSIIRDNRALRGPQFATWYLDSTISYCDVQGGEDDVFLWDMWGGGASIDWGEGNIDADPCFVEAGWWDPNDTPTDPNDDFWVDGDYHLQPTSPCIDVGDNSSVDANSTDFDGNPRIVDGNDDDNRVVDMGAYEYWKYARNLADLNGDGVVDYGDFVILASNWMEENCPVSAWCAGCDLNHSGKVDSTDLFSVVRSWLWQMETEPDLDFDLDNLWMYQNLPGQTASNLTAAVSISYDPLDNSSYTYLWEIIVADDVSTAPVITDGGTADDDFCTFAALACDQPQGLSDSGQPFMIRVTVTGDSFGNTSTAEAQFGIALLGDVNNDTVVNVADRGIINAFWRTGAAGDFTLRDCDINSDTAVNVADRAIANAVWRGVLGTNSVTTPCPFR